MKRSIGPRQQERAHQEAEHVMLWAKAVYQGLANSKTALEGEYDESVLEQLAAIERNACALRERLAKTTKRIAPEDPTDEDTTCPDCGMMVKTRWGTGVNESGNRCPQSTSRHLPGHRVEREVFQNWEARMREYDAYQAKSAKAGA